MNKYNPQRIAKQISNIKIRRRTMILPIKGSVHKYCELDKWYLHDCLNKPGNSYWRTHNTKPKYKQINRDTIRRK